LAHLLEKKHGNFGRGDLVRESDGGSSINTLAVPEGPAEVSKEEKAKKGELGATPNISKGKGKNTSNYSPREMCITKGEGRRGRKNLLSTGAKNKKSW